MPLFYFDLARISEEIDEEGVELISQEAARRQIIRLASEILRDKGEDMSRGITWRFSVRDEVGAKLLSVSLSYN